MQKYTNIYKTRHFYLRSNISNKPEEVWRRFCNSSIASNPHLHRPVLRFYSPTSGE